MGEKTGGRGDETENFRTKTVFIDGGCLTTGGVLPILQTKPKS